MDFLGFVNWRSVNTRFCALIWLIAGVLAVFVLAHLGQPGTATHVHHAMASARR